MADLLTACLLLLFGLPAAYLVSCLLLEEKTSHEGPFLVKHTFVVFPDSGHIQRASLFDTIRRVFGVYTVIGRKWYVNPVRAEYFSCPFCLSFWCAIPFSLLGLHLTGLPLGWLPAVLFGIAAVSRISYRLMWHE